MLRKLKIQIKDMTQNKSFVDYVNKRLEPLERFFKNKEGMRWNVRMSKDGHHKKGDDIYHVEAQVRTPKKNYGAEASGADPYEAIDELKDELSHKIVGHKEKRITRMREGARRAKRMIRGEK